MDEGPGLSGSSMAAVAEAARRAGVPRERVAFLPGHPGEPGAQASETTRAWWRDAERFVVGAEELRWEGLTLEETLAARTDEAVAVEELTGGRWRALAYRDEGERPPLDAPFERRKLLVRRADGSALLWKFVGLAVPGTTLGFAAAPWIEGVALTRGDASPALLETIGRHLAAAAGPPLAPSVAAATHARLAGMLQANAGEAGIEALPFPERSRESSRSAGDDRLAPWEWRRLPDGGIVKAGRKSPAGDHTVVGRTPVEWDVAAAIVEWGLDLRTAEPLLAPVRRRFPIDPAALRFHRAAYAAFRLGMAVHVGSGAEKRYRAALLAALDDRGYWVDGDDSVPPWPHGPRTGA